MSVAAQPPRYRWRLARFASDIPEGTPGEVRHDAYYICCSTQGHGVIAARWIVGESMDARYRRYACQECAGRFAVLPGAAVIVKESIALEYRPMSADERTMAIALGAVTMIPGLPSKRFARDLAATAESFGTITEKQASALRSLVVRYRRQIPVAIVALAGHLGELAVAKVTS